MRRLYKPFFIVYGVAHIMAGLTLAFTREFFSFILTPPPLPGPAILIAFLLIFAGLALFGIAFVESARSRQLIIRLVIAGNVLSAVAQLINSFSDRAPIYVGPVAAVIVALIIILLIAIDRAIRFERESDLPSPK